MRPTGYLHGQWIDEVRRDVHLVLCELDSLHADPLHHLFGLGSEDKQLRHFSHSK